MTPHKFEVVIVVPGAQAPWGSWDDREGEITILASSVEEAKERVKTLLPWAIVVSVKEA